MRSFNTLALCLFCLSINYTTGRNIEPRIVGGKKVAKERYPYYGFPAGSYNCGASLIWTDILVSAAHCMQAFSEAGLHLGGNTIDGRTSTYYPVNHILEHPEYDEEMYYNDIMLIRINGSAPEPYAILNYDSTIPSTLDTVTVIGYGNTAEDGPYSYELMSVDLQVEDFSKCGDYFGHYADETIMLCTVGSPEGGKDSCQGDSGGPVFLGDTDVQVGIVSFGDGCARANVPAVNVKVSAYQEWIEDEICKLSAYPPSTCTKSTGSLVHKLRQSHDQQGAQGKEQASCAALKASCGKTSHCCGHEAGAIQCSHSGPKHNPQSKICTKV